MRANCEFHIYPTVQVLVKWKACKCSPGEKKKRQGGCNKMARCIPDYGATRLLTYCLDLSSLIRSRNSGGYDALPVCAPSPPKQRHLVCPDSVWITTKWQFALRAVHQYDIITTGDLLLITWKHMLLHEPGPLVTWAGFFCFFLHATVRASVCTARLGAQIRCLCVRFWLKANVCLLCAHYCSGPQDSQGDFASL